MIEGQELKCERAAGSVGLTHPSVMRRMRTLCYRVLFGALIFGSYREVAMVCVCVGGGGRMEFFRIIFCFLNEKEEDREGEGEVRN